MGLACSQPVIKFEYLDIPVGGRGGAIRMFFLAHGLKYDEELYEMTSAWPAKKAELVKSGESPGNQVPVTTYGDMVLTQHIATMRYIALDLGLGSSPKGNFAQDVSERSPCLLS